MIPGNDQSGRETFMPTFARKAAKGSRSVLVGDGGPRQFFSFDVCFRGFLLFNCLDHFDEHPQCWFIALGGEPGPICA